MLVLASISACAAIRLLGAGLAFIPHHFALAIIVILAVFGTLQGLSILWNVATRNPWNHKNVFEYVSDLVVLLPWP